MTNLIDANLAGVVPISVTPFLDDGSIDHASMDRLADYFVALGVPALTLLGVMGEATKLDEAEAVGLVQRVARRTGGRMRIIAGVNHGGLDGYVAFARRLMDAGAGGIMVAPSAGLRNEEQVLQSMAALIDRLGDRVPIVLQDYPQLTGVFMSVDTVARLIERHPGIVVVKHEEGSAMRKITRLRAGERAGRRRVAILVGNSAIHLPQELDRGADGANTGVAFPEILVEVCRRHRAGETDRAEDLYDAFLPLIRHEWQPGIGLAIRKEVFRRRGLISSARCRAPGPALDATDHAEITRLLARLSRRLADMGEERIIASHQPEIGAA